MTFGLHELQKNMIFGEQSVIATNYFVVTSAHSHCSHLKQLSHLILPSSTFLLHEIHRIQLVPSLSLVFARRSSSSGFVTF